MGSVERRGRLGSRKATVLPTAKQAAVMSMMYLRLKSTSLCLVLFSEHASSSYPSRLLRAFSSNPETVSLTWRRARPM